MNKICILLGSTVPFSNLEIKSNGIDYSKDSIEDVITDVKSSFYLPTLTEEECTFKSINQNATGTTFEFTFTSSERELMNKTFIPFSSFLEHSRVINRSYSPTKEKMQEILYGKREISKEEQAEVTFYETLSSQNDTLVSCLGDIALVHKPSIYMENGYQLVTTKQTPIDSKDYKFNQKREYLLPTEEVSHLVAHDLKLTKAKTLTLKPKTTYQNQN